MYYNTVTRATATVSSTQVKKTKREHTRKSPQPLIVESPMCEPLPQLNTPGRHTHAIRNNTQANSQGIKGKDLE